ncbi:MAG TPA: SDR family oxidoreductase [Abditibacteriaceae bacterium]|jgi:NAD(P)-dependent dehydrogenase (short-subunit alcohol dehydrogenase family)
MNDHNEEQVWRRPPTAPDFSLNGRVALITGAGRGIGRGIAYALASAGCAVAVQDIDLDVAQEAVAELAETGAKAVAFGGDIHDLELPARLVAQTQEQLGGLHILVNNASVQKSLNWMELDVAEIERQLRADFVSPILFCQEAARCFEAHGWGRILNIGSVQGRSGNPGMLPYSMSKAAMQNMTTALARELGKRNVTVNLLAPGYFNTWRNRGDFPNHEELERRGQWLPLGRVGQPEDCGGVAVLLCSEAGSYITGQTIYVDGGFTTR